MTFECRAKVMQVTEQSIESRQVRIGKKANSVVRDVRGWLEVDTSFFGDNWFDSLARLSRT